MSDQELAYRAQMKIAAGQIQMLQALLHSDGWKLLEQQLSLGEETALANASIAKDGMESIRQVATWRALKTTRIWPQSQVEYLKQMLLAEQGIDSLAQK